MAGLNPICISNRIMGKTLPSVSLNSAIRYKKKYHPAPLTTSGKTLLDHFNDGVLNNLGKTKDLALKPIYHFTGWLKYGLGDEMPRELEAFGASVKSTKNWLGLAEIPGKVLKVARSVMNFDPVNIFFDGAECVNPVYDVASEMVGAGVIQATKETMRKFSLLNYGALLVGQSKQAWETISKLAKQTLTDAQQFLMGLGLGKNACYVSLAITGLVLGGQASILLLAFSTGALFFSNAHFYYDRIVEPNKHALLKNA